MFTLLYEKKWYNFCVLELCWNNVLNHTVTGVPYSIVLTFAYFYSHFPAGSNGNNVLKVMEFPFLGYCILSSLSSTNWSDKITKMAARFPADFPKEIAMGILETIQTFLEHVDCFSVCRRPFWNMLLLRYTDWSNWNNNIFLGNNEIDSYMTGQ